jgi:predicted nucleic acid-binding protein
LDSVEILRYAEKGDIKCYLTSNSITDLMYILRKYINDIKIREEAIKNILQIVDIVSVGKKEIFNAFDLEYSDFEDALQICCAKKIKAHYVITRNIKDFKNSDIKIKIPKAFIDLLKNQK